MSGGGNYTENFGTRMKRYIPQGRRRPLQIHRAPLWIRFSRTWGIGLKKRRGPWAYCWWTRPLSGVRDFVRADVGSFREFEHLGRERPAINDVPFKVLPSGIELFLEKSL